ncbi:MAG: hypothetical protein FWE89_02215 [Syntrophaceae bacterium]|nr:hypothetical protein [Syntrophaceae bacterium]
MSTLSKSIATNCSFEEGSGGSSSLAGAPAAGIGEGKTATGADAGLRERGGTAGEGGCAEATAGAGGSGEAAGAFSSPAGSASFCCSGPETLLDSAGAFFCTAGEEGAAAAAAGGRGADTGVKGCSSPASLAAPAPPGARQSPKRTARKDSTQARLGFTRAGRA